MKQFQYKEITCSLPAGVAEMMTQINRLGADGWELVSVCPTDASEYGFSALSAFLKKEVVQ